MSVDLVEFESAINKKPPDGLGALAIVPVESHPYVATCVATIERMAKQMDLLVATRDTSCKASRKTVRKTLLAYPELLNGYEYKNDKVFYLGKEIAGNSERIILFAQDLEDKFFPNKEIDCSTMIEAVKAALIKKADIENDDIPETVLLIIFNEYINAAKTKRRTRMPLKLMVDCFDFKREKVLDAINKATSLEIIDTPDKNGRFVRSTIPPKNGI